MSDDTTVVKPFAAWLPRLPGKFEDLVAQINYVQTQGGPVQFRVVPYGVVSEKVDGEPLVAGPMELPPLPPLKIWLNTPKIPWASYARIIAFFRAVYAKEKSEAIIRVFWDPRDVAVEQRWILHCPEQKVSGGHVDHKDDFDSDGKLRHVADIHSHNTMPAFFSGTDDADEKKAVRLYGVVGNLLQPIPASSWRAWTGKKFEELDLTDVVELPTDEELTLTVKFPLRKMAAEKGGLKDFSVDSEALTSALLPGDFPLEWMEKINPKGFMTGTHRGGSDITTWKDGKARTWRYDLGKRKWVNERGDEMEVRDAHDEPTAESFRTGKGRRHPTMGFGQGHFLGRNPDDIDDDRALERRGGGGQQGKGNGGERRGRNAAAKKAIPYDDLGPGEKMVGSALWAALDVDILVYLVDVQRDDVYRVYPDQKVQLRGLCATDLVQMKERKKNVSMTDTKIFGALTLTKETIMSCVETFQSLRTSRGGGDGKKDEVQ